MSTLPAGLRTPLVRVGSYFMVGHDQEAAGSSLGIKGGALYFRGRIGPLVGADSTRAAAVYRIFPQGLLDHVFRSTAQVDAATAATAYEQAAAHAAQRLLAPTYPDTPELDELPALVRAVLAVAELPEIDATTVTRIWRDRRWPAQDGPLGAYWALVLLRELRGSRHFQALDAAGLDTGAASWADPHVGPDVLARRGWRPEQITELERLAGAVPDLTARRDAVEEATDAALLADLQAVLTAEQIERLGELVVTAENSAAAAQGSG